MLYRMLYVKGQGSIRQEIFEEFGLCANVNISCFPIHINFLN